MGCVALVEGLREPDASDELRGSHWARATSFLCRGRRRVEGKRTAMKTPGPISMGPGVSVDALAGRCRPKSLPGRCALPGRLPAATAVP